MTDIDALRRTFTTNLLQTGRQWRRAVDQQLGSHGISEACAAPLLWIGRLGGGVRQIVVANHVGIEGASLVRLLDQLEEQGLILRKSDPDDRRANGLWLTEEGSRLAEHMESILVGLRAQILADVSEADLLAALRVLQAFDAAGSIPLPRGTVPAEAQQ
ncbi:MAG: MarR family transcriptional regulator [Shinella sp.]|nr:MarR family transcriptional regulator [Shinella sp.]